MTSALPAPEQQPEQQPEQFTSQEGELLFFTDEGSKERSQPNQDDLGDVWKIMIVDDEPDVHEVTKIALRNFRFEERALQFISAYSGVEAIDLIDAHPDTAMILLDVVMESNDAGLTVAHYIREGLGNHLTRLVIRTGQPGEAPESSVILDYDINDYKTKTEFTQQKLFTAVITSLRAYRDILSFERHQNALAEKDAECTRIASQEQSESPQRQQEISEYQLAEMELQETKDMTEAIHSAQDQFLTNMNTALRPSFKELFAHSEIFRQGIYGSLAEQQRNALHATDQSSHQVLALIGEIINDTNMEESKLILDMQNTSVEALCTDSLQLIMTVAKKKAIDVQFRLDDQVTEMWTDQQRLEQILISLLANAAKFTPNGGQIGLTVTGAPEDMTVHFNVWDTGIGIFPEDMEKFFQSVLQSDGTTIHRYKGPGLGLSLVQRLTEMHGGTITVQSEVGQGSQFIVSLPW